MPDPAVGVVEAIAEKRGKDPTEMDFVLEEHIPTDALSQLAASQSEWELRFRVDGFTAKVDSAGNIAVTPIEERGSRMPLSGQD